MKPYRSICLLVLICGTLVCSCKDVFEPNIKDRKVALQAPGDKSVSVAYNLIFWWDEVPDALSYRLQVVSPDFAAVSTLVLDTVVRVGKFSVTLAPGNYEWRVRAENGSSKTEYSNPRSFTIAFSSIKGQKVQLRTPANNTLTNIAVASFSWGDLYGATKFRLQIDTANFVNENALVYDRTVPGLQANFTFSKDQTYQWRVRAENDTAQAMWSAISNIVYDHTPPAKPVLTAPAKGQSVPQPVPLQWNASSGAVKYKLYVLKSDSTSNYNSSFPALLNTNSYNFTLGTPGERVYWKVSAIDAAGNESTASELRNFLIQL